MHLCITTAPTATTAPVSIHTPDRTGQRCPKQTPSSTMIAPLVGQEEAIEKS